MTTVYTPRWTDPDAGIGRILDREKQVVVGRFPTHRECRVHDPPVDVDTKIDLQNVLVLKHLHRRGRQVLNFGTPGRASSPIVSPAFGV